MIEAELSPLAARIDALLPQTQCTKCGYDGCAPYAAAIAEGSALHNRCPPGGAEGIARLAALLGRAPLPLDASCGVERPRPVAVIDESLCIGCTLCLKACPVDAIVGAPKSMHTVLADSCTGCDLCVPPCPVDCIEMRPVTGTATGWDAWSAERADQARAEYHRHLARPPAQVRKSALTAAPRQAGSSAGADADTTLTSSASSGSSNAAAPSNLGASIEAEAEAEQARKRAIVQAAIERARLRKLALAAEAEKTGQ